MKHLFLTQMKQQRWLDEFDQDRPQALIQCSSSSLGSRVVKVSAATATVHLLKGAGTSATSFTPSSCCSLFLVVLGWNFQWVFFNDYFLCLMMAGNTDRRRENYTNWFPSSSCYLFKLRGRERENRLLVDLLEVNFPIYPPQPTSSSSAEQSRCTQRCCCSLSSTSCRAAR